MRASWVMAGVAAILLAGCSQAVDGNPGAADRPGTTSTATASGGPSSPGTTEPTDSAPPTGGPIGSGDVDGNWSGTTSQSQPITFTIAGDSLTKLSIKGRYNGDACPITSTAYSMSGDTPVEGGRFVQGDSATDKYVIEGAFESASKARGSAQFIAKDAAESMGCKSVTVTWTATRVGGPTG